MYFNLEMITFHNIIHNNSKNIHYKIIIIQI